MARFMTPVKIIIVATVFLLGWRIWKYVVKRDHGQEDRQGVAIQLRRLARLHNFCSSQDGAYSTTQNYSGEHYHLIQPFILVDSVHRVVLNSLPKTGSTSWRLVLLNSSGSYTLTPGQKIGFVHDARLFRSVRGVYTRTATMMDRNSVVEALNTYRTILTVRHPFDRLESAYEDLVISYNYVHTREKILREKGIGESSISKRAVNGSSVTFEDFLRYILSHADRHWQSMSEISLPCEVSYSYIAKTESMGQDLHTVIHSFLSGHVTSVHMNSKRPNSTMSQTYARGRYLPLFSSLPNKNMWLSRVAEKYAADLQMFGYNYRVDRNGLVYATCQEYDHAGTCV